MYFLRKLKSAGVRTSVLVKFYSAIIESVLCFSITVWFGRVTANDLMKFNSVIRSAEKIIGTGLPSLQSIYNDRIKMRTAAIMNDEYHPAHGYFTFLPSGKRSRTFYGNKRFVNSFYPQAVKIFNS